MRRRRSKMPFERPIDTALDFAARGGCAELDVVIVQEVLADHGHLEARNRLPAEAQVELTVCRDLLVDDVTHVADRAVEAEVAREGLV